MTLFLYQRVVRDRRDLGLALWLWRRQGGKTTSLALHALRKMASHRARLVTFASASLLVGREVIQREADLFRNLLENYASTANARVEAVDSANGKRPELADDFREVFSTGRMEARLWHGRTTYSRTLIVAPNPATARSFSGDVMIDEIGWIKAFREVWDAMEPIFSSDPTFTALMATTPPADEAHFAHELSIEPPGTVFEPCAEGHWYRSVGGVMVHRVDVDDAEAAGRHLYHPETREQITPEAHRLLSLDRESWDRNYKLKGAKSSTAAVSAVALGNAQSHALSSQCLAVDVGEEIPPTFASLMGSCPVAIGLDIATTEGGKSNPSGLAVVEKVGLDFAFRLIARWKTADPNVARKNLRQVVDALVARSLIIDATNERYFATDLRRQLGALIHVQLMITSEAIIHRGESMNYKTFLGNQLVNALDDGRVALPDARWIYDDWRLVKKKRGLFDNEVDANGNHGDTFDGAKYALFGLLQAGGPMHFTPVEISGYGRSAGRGVLV